MGNRREGRIASCREGLCAVPASPELAARIKEQMAALRSNTALAASLQGMLQFQFPVRVGLNDGTIFPASYFPLGTPAEVVRSAAASRAPLRGTVRVIVVLVQFPDKNMTATVQHFKDLFFSTGVVASGSVKEYFQEVTHGLIDITGEVVGPFTLGHPITYYANNQSGLGNAAPNARNMAYDAAVAANPSVNFSPYDNDGNGFVDAFIVIHAGSGGEVTGSSNDIWSHKWTLAGGAYKADSTKIYAYLTVPEDCKLGVCAHELGHLLFGFPDLYDTDYSSEGAGNWCLMAGGSWNGGGNTPAHPSAWCKANQGWVSVTTQSATADVSIPDVKTSHNVIRLWKNGGTGSEYFLIENRQKTLFDKALPGAGLLIWHIDEAVAGNSGENHPKVALEQADNRKDLERGTNRGDAGDPYPGSSNNRSFSGSSSPNSNSYANAETYVSVTNISDPAPTMTARLAVSCASVKTRTSAGKTIESEKVVHDEALREPKLRIGGKPSTGERVGLDKGAGRLTGFPDGGTGADGAAGAATPASAPPATATPAAAAPTLQ